MTSALITGGTGTFGQAIALKLLGMDKVSRVSIYSRDEQKQEQMRRSFPNDERIRYFVGDVRDKDRLLMAMHGVDVVFHAAAMKIVPVCEYDPLEALKTNVIGTANVVQAAIKRGVPHVIGVSTDKACNPVNFYGVTKLTLEKLMAAANNLAGGSGVMFSVARYGNVSGSRGSVIPHWRQLAKDGAPLPVTHEDMTRFWITIDQATDFVIEAVSYQQGGEVFIPKMRSYRVMDLARAVYGTPEFPYQIVGVRPGEKIHEDLITTHEAASTLEINDAYVICPQGKRPSNPVPDGFSLASNTNGDFLSVAELTEMLKNVH